jgi:hypothetical protein
MITAKEARELLEKEIEKSNGQWLVELEREIEYNIVQNLKDSIMVDFGTLSPKGRLETLTGLGYKVHGRYIHPDGPSMYCAQQYDYWLISW